jgi:hypothetical protein
MYLIVRGYCRAVYQSTLTKLADHKAISRFCNSKDLYGEIGVVQKGLNSVNPNFYVKNIKKELRPILERMKPEYLPKTKPKIKFLT